MDLEELGFNETIETQLQELDLDSSEVGRVIAEHKERYIVMSADGEYECEITGKIRFAAQDRASFPTVGDWVAISVHGDKATIESILPRSSMLERQAVGKHAEKQIIATNVDFALILIAVDRDFNVNRIERYLTICQASSVEPIIVLSKIDLISEQELKEIIEDVKKRIVGTSVITISNKSQAGYPEIKDIIKTGKTYCLLGSSGVGKSSLINGLTGGSTQETGAISDKSDRGKHVTTHRELVTLENGGVLIDNPGMREVGTADAVMGLEATFSEIVELSRQCKFNDCQHATEKGCAVLQAIDDGVIDKESYDNYTRMQREQEYYRSSVAEKRKKDKDFGKMVKQHVNKKRNRK